MFGSAREVFVYNKSKETFLSFRVRVADSFSSRLIGLLGKRSLKPDGGVWIVPANSIHTVGMLFSFDLVMIDKDFRVVNVKEMVQPFRIVWPKLRAESVIELPAHTIFRSRTEVGDQLIIERYEAKRTVIPKSNLVAMQVSREDHTILEGVAHAEGTRE
jgi:uncharacterized membrane protein (UPF0127 family)